MSTIVCTNEKWFYCINGPKFYVTLPSQKKKFYVTLEQDNPLPI